MSLEFFPPSLQSVITGYKAEKRLKGREGVAIALDMKSVRTGWSFEGSILTVHALAVQHHDQNPGLRMLIIEDTCNVGVEAERVDTTKFNPRKL